jgi:hypothetical protein
VRSLSGERRSASRAASVVSVPRASSEIATSRIGFPSRSSSCTQKPQPLVRPCSLKSRRLRPFGSVTSYLNMPGRMSWLVVVFPTRSRSRKTLWSSSEPTASRAARASGASM